MQLCASKLKNAPGDEQYVRLSCHLVTKLPFLSWYIVGSGPSEVAPCHLAFDPTGVVVRGDGSLGALFEAYFSRSLSRLPSALRVNSIKRRRACRDPMREHVALASTVGASHFLRKSLSSLVTPTP